MSRQLPNEKNSGISASKNPCPICGRDKTAWSSKCTRCEGNRQRYLTAVERHEDDIQFLSQFEGPRRRTLQEVANEMGITRQRVHQLKVDAADRVSFLKQHPAPRRAFMQVPA